MAIAIRFDRGYGNAHAITWPPFGEPIWSWPPAATTTYWRDRGPAGRLREDRGGNEQRERGGGEATEIPAE